MIAKSFANVILSLKKKGIRFILYCFTFDNLL